VSQPSYASNPGGVVVQKPKWDIYTTMLALAFLAIIIAITLLCLEMSAFNWDIKANEGKLQQTAAARPVVRDALAALPLVGPLFV
jgi:hypothetical protein